MPRRPLFPQPPSPIQPWMRLMEPGQLQWVGGETTAGQREGEGGRPFPHLGRVPARAGEEGETGPLCTPLFQERNVSLQLPLTLLLPLLVIQADRCLWIPQMARPLSSSHVFQALARAAPHCHRPCKLGAPSTHGGRKALPPLAVPQAMGAEGRSWAF